MQNPFNTTVSDDDNRILEIIGTSSRIGKLCKLLLGSRLCCHEGVSARQPRPINPEPGFADEEFYEQPVQCVEGSMVRPLAMSHLQ
jgi:hypothetical protein